MFFLVEPLAGHSLFYDVFAAVVGLQWFSLVGRPGHHFFDFLPHRRIRGLRSLRARLRSRLLEHVRGLRSLLYFLYGRT